MLNTTLTGNCIARLVVDSPAYVFVKALYAIHKQQGSYDFVHINDILKNIDPHIQNTIKDFENGILDTLIRMQIIEQNLVHDLKFQIHQDHWIPFTTLPEWFHSGFFCLI